MNRYKVKTKGSNIVVSGRNLKEVVYHMMMTSFSEDTSVKEYMEGVGRRYKITYGISIRTNTPVKFIHDLEKEGYAWRIKGDSDEDRKCKKVNS